MNNKINFALIQGASRGIGLAFVRQLLGHQTQVVATCRQPADAHALLALREEFPTQLQVIPLDVTDEASIQTAAAQVMTPLDLLVNAAGVLHRGPGMQPEKRLDDLTVDNLLWSYQVNAMGPVLMAKHFGRHLVHKERAVFASISARVGSIGDNQLGGWHAYRAAKAAQNMFTRNISIELRRKSKQFIAVGLHPGSVDTELSRPFQSRIAHQVFTPDEAAIQLLDVIDRLTPEDSGQFFEYNGQALPW